MRKTLTIIATLALVVSLTTMSAVQWGAGQAARELIRELKDGPPIVNVTKQVTAMLVSPAYAKPLERPSDCSTWDSEREVCLIYSPRSLEAADPNPRPPEYVGTRASDLASGQAWGEIEYPNPHDVRPATAAPKPLVTAVP